MLRFIAGIDKVQYPCNMGEGRAATYECKRFDFRERGLLLSGHGVGENKADVLWHQSLRLR